MSVSRKRCWDLKMASGSSSSIAIGGAGEGEDDDLDLNLRHPIKDYFTYDPVLE